MEHATDLPFSNLADELHLALLQSVPDGMCFIDLGGAVRFWNDAAEQISGFSIAEAVCAAYAGDVYSLNSADGEPIGLISFADVTPEWTQPHSAFLRHKDGHHLPVAIRVVPVSTGSGEPFGVLYLFSSLADHSEERLAQIPEDFHTAQRPVLGSVTEQLDHALRATRQGGRPAAIFLIHIDDFENMRRRLGPEASDKLLLLVDKTTSNCLHPGDSMTRLSDGVLLVILTPTVKRDAAVLARQICRLVESARMEWWGNREQITITVGTTMLNGHDSPATALSRAEDCVQRGMAAGGNRVVMA